MYLQSINEEWLKYYSTSLIRLYFWIALKKLKKLDPISLFYNHELNEVVVRRRRRERLFLMKEADSWSDVSYVGMLLVFGGLALVFIMHHCLII